MDQSSEGKRNKGEKAEEGKRGRVTDKRDRDRDRGREKENTMERQRQRITGEDDQSEKNKEMNERA